mgnify:CR=1 FL=1
MGLEQRGRGGKEHKRKFEIENATEFRRVFFFAVKRYCLTSSPSNSKTKVLFLSTSRLKTLSP